MKHILLIILSVFLSFTTLLAQDFWERISIPENLIISCMALNKDGEIFIGTGIENDLNGVYKSTDTGKTWTHVLNTETFQVNAIGIDNANHIYVHANGLHQFWISPDDGETFNELPWNNTAVTQIVSLGTDTLLLGCVGPGMGVMVLKTYNGCQTFDTLYAPGLLANNQISDLTVASNGYIYFSLMCFTPHDGGVYRTTDNGQTWTELGFDNNQVQAVEVNKQGDVFIGVYHNFNWGEGGLYAIYHDSSTIDTLLFGPEVNGITINSAGDIYAGTSFGVIVSKDNGVTFENRSSGLLSGFLGKLMNDSNDYIFALLDGWSNYLYKTINSTVTSIKIPKRIEKNEELFLFPNPVNDILNLKLENNYQDLKTVNCYIYDNSNKLILKKRILVSDNKISFNTARLPKGIYQLIIISEFKIQHASFVKL